MLFILSLALIAIGAVCYIAYFRSYKIQEWVFGISFMGLIIGILSTLVMLVVLACNHIGIDGKIASFNARYDSLVYQYENDIYDNDNDLGKRDLMEDIECWNRDLAYRKENQDDFWIGIFYPNIYDQFEFIELEKGE